MRGTPLLKGLSKIFHQGRTIEQQNQIIELLLILKDHSLSQLVDQKEKMALERDVTRVLPRVKTWKTHHLGIKSVIPQGRTKYKVHMPHILERSRTQE